MGQKGRTASWRIGSTFLAVTALASLAIGGDPVEKGIGDPYPFAYCVLVPDVELDDDIKILDFDGREVRVCCGDCADRARRDTYNVLRQIDELVVKEQKALYPLTTCLVDDKPLGDNPIDFPFRNRLFRVCSGECQSQIEKKPAVHFGKLDFAVIEKQKAKYPLDHCVVSGKPLGGGGVDHVAANRLVRLSGYDQLGAFSKSPGKYLKMVQEAAEKAPAK